MTKNPPRNSSSGTRISDTHAPFSITARRAGLMKSGIDSRGHQTPERTTWGRMTIGMNWRT